MKRLASFVRVAVVSAACLGAAISMAQDESLDASVDKSINAGLDYLASSQLPDGSYPGQHGKGGAISALAGMAFLAKGHTPGDDRYGTCIYKSIDYILGIAGKNGFFGTVQEGNGKMYAHSICTLFLSEVSGMVDAERQAKIDDMMPKAVKILLDAQNIKKSERDAGGWRYATTSNDSDMSCSGWALMALRSCRLNGGRVPGDAIERAVEYVKRHSDAAQGNFVYQQGNASHGITLTGAGILCLELCGRHNDPASLRAARFLMRSYRELENSGMKFYGMYYTSQGLFQIGGEGWKVFSNWMYRTWIPKQGGDGSWGDNGEVSRPYCTSLMLLAFTVPYRQLPIYQRDETVDED